MYSASKRRIITGPVGVLAAAAATIALLAGPSQAADDGTCTTVNVPVALAPGQLADRVISGSLCTPNSYGGPVHRVDLLVHGGTYNSMYWNWPVHPELYSYIRKTMGANRAAFAFDRLGTGDSTRPSSASLTVAADSYVLHQLVQWLRGSGFDQVTAIGHSLGSAVSITEAAAYNDIDRLVVTGLVHPPGLGMEMPPLFGSFYPAALDPQFFGQVLDPGYLTTRPGTRDDSFYYTPTADPEVIAYDEAHKDIMSEVEFASAADRVYIPAGLNDTNRVRVPVLVMVGQHDTIFCGLLLNCSNGDNVRVNETPYYTSAPSLTGDAVPDTGHSLTLHPSADTSFAHINQWINSH